MYVQELSIEIKTKADKDELVDALMLLIDYYRGNGQVQGDIQSQYISDNKIVCLPFSIDENSLDTQFNNDYVKKQIPILEKLCGSELKIRTIGKTHESYEGSCHCAESEFYILMTNYVSIDSPLTCGTCHKSVPLYRLPIFHDFGYMPIIRWASNYVSCDSLQMNGEVGEPWATNQMQEYTSQLSKQGLEICKKLEELTGIPTYYYLYNYRKLAKETEFSSACPKCKAKWKLKKQLHDFYDFKCDRCMIISTKSVN